MSILSILDALLLGPLKLLFEVIFVFAERMVGHPGLAIICLSLAMNILVLPLYKRADAMQEAARDVEARLHDGVAHIKKTFSGDERMMILQAYYRQNHYKPLSALNGSVSLLLEVPFFMAAYQFLSKLEILEGVSLGPISDLAAPDGLLVIGGIAINVLPIVMTLVNVISSAIYLKGFPLKTKIQLYGMALFFLVFLYTSPSGLVFYWTLNNLFSLGKTIIYKIKSPKLVRTLLCLISGAGVLFFDFYLYVENSAAKKLLLAGVGILLLLLPLVQFLPKSGKKLPKVTAQPSRSRFLMGALVLTVLTGLLIPSTFIAASPQEFVDLNYFYHPLWFVVSAFCLSAGTFLVWMGVFYWLADKDGKVLFGRLVWVLCGVMLVNYMFFGTDLGVISSTLKYEQELDFTTREKLINLAIIAAVAIVLYLLACKAKRLVGIVLLTAIIALGGMSAMNMITVKKSIDQLQVSDSNQVDVPHFTLSTTGENVVVIMLDRAMGEYLPYMLAEKPELKEQFDGFTYYENTISFGGHTNVAMPALMGGYEYTPVELNKRNAEFLKDKHNEALKVMPVTFLENGFDVTVCDPAYANYQWIPDLTIYDDYPDINAYNIEGVFNDPLRQDVITRCNQRNFFMFSLVKSMPLILQPTLYNGGLYNQVSGGTQLAHSTDTASGPPLSFLSSYQVLTNLSEMTQISQESTNTFLCMVSNATHDPFLLQTPDYVPADEVDNTAYDKAHADRFTVNGETLLTETPQQMTQYHVNMAALLRLGEWLEELKESGVYDNTRIILVSDHGFNTHQLEKLLIPGAPTEDDDLTYYYPLLMVKDFDAHGFTVSEEFMTNADVPTLAMAEVIENPVNPFSGKPINNSEKYAHDQFVTFCHVWDVGLNNGTTFLPSAWASVSKDMRDLKNWTFYEEETVLKEHRFP